VAKVSVEQALAKAKSHIKKGELAEAQTLYATILQAFPNNKKAQQALATLGGGQQSAAEQGPPQAVIDQLISLYNQGKLAVVVEQAKELTEQYPTSCVLWNILGVANKGLNKIDEATNAFRKVTQLNPNYADGYSNLGVALGDQDQLDEAIRAYEKAINLQPNFHEAHNNMGTVLRRKGQLEQAINSYKKAISIKPNYIEAHNNLGVALAKKNNLREAIASYQQALSLKPDYAEVYSNMGIAFKDQGKLEEAIEAYNKALTIKPDYAEVYSNMGIALKDQGKLEEAIEAHNKALAIKPDSAEAYSNMGNALQEQGQLEGAIEAYNKALTIKPDYANAYSNMGNALKDQGKLEEAIEAYNKALAIKPDYVEAHHNMSFACLSVKNFEQGFEKHEWRWKTKQFKTQYLKTKKPTWSGETRQRVLVWAEQGIGDEIMFSSIIPEIYATSSKVLVKCDKRLIPLFERSFSDDITYYSRDANVSEDEYDFHIPMGSLPLTFRKSLDSFKNSASGFLKCDMARAERIKGQLSHEPGKKLVGISWKTKSLLRNSSTRNINLADLARALDNSKTQLVCLQYGDVSDEISAVKRDFGIDVIQFDKVDNKYDIDGLASLILACDQIVSTTNVTVHLAGALGVKVTALLPFAPRWIWGDGSESFLYESVIPIKQKYHHNWNNVLASLRSNSYNLF